MRILILIFCFTLPLVGTSLPSEKRKNGQLIQGVLAPVQVSLQESSAVFFNNEDSRPFLYGTVVTEDGWILTKASELDEVGDFHVRVGAKKYRSPKIISRNDVWDVILVKIEAEGLRPVDMGRIPDLAHGTWVVSNGAAERRFRRPRPGIISANMRKIPGGSPGVLGVSFREEGGEMILASVLAESGAERAGLMKGDHLLSIAGVEVAGRDHFLERLQKNSPGDWVMVQVKRGGDLLEFKVELMARHKLYQEELNRNDQLSGGVEQQSARRRGFPMVIQHETMLTRRGVGGPVFTLDGVFVGMNIAAVNRVEVYAIPSESLMEVFEKLSRGFLEE